MKIGVIDYGASNIFSVARALRFLGADVKIVDAPEKLKNIDKYVFPGQGSMGSCVKKLKANEMFNPLINEIKSKPFLGICLGLQILFNSSEEDSESGFGLIEGKITKIKVSDKQNLKIPHMGWNHVSFSKDHNLFEGIKNNQFFYFVHSYVSYDAKDNIIANTTYGKEFISALSSENIFATQFHPEKSGKIGLKLLDNFINWKI